MIVAWSSNEKKLKKLNRNANVGGVAESQEILLMGAWTSASRRSCERRCRLLDDFTVTQQQQQHKGKKKNTLEDTAREGAGGEMQ